MSDHFRDVYLRATRARARRRAAPTDGAEAFRRGFTLDTNPHPLADPERGQWRQDWIDARDANEAMS